MFHVYGNFGDDVTRMLVGAEPEIGGLTKVAVTCPLGEAHLDDELGRCPMNAGANVYVVDERCGLPLQLAQAIVQLAQDLHAESGAHRAYELKALFLVDAKQKRSEALPTTLWLRPTSHDELLLVRGFDLHPIATAPFLIG